MVGDSKKISFKFQTVTKNNFVKPDPHKQYYALKKINDTEYEVIASSNSTSYLIKRGHKLLFDVLYREFLEVQYNEQGT